MSPKEQSINQIKRLIGFFPNIQVLEVMTAHKMAILQNQLPHLTRLRISGLIGGSIENCSFGNLVMLQIDGCWLSANDWTVFLAKIPQLRMLIMTDFVLQEDSLMAICNIKHLVDLQLNYGLYPVTLMTRILDRCRNLKILTLTERTLQQFATQMPAELPFEVKVKCLMR